MSSLSNKTGREKKTQNQRDKGSSRPNSMQVATKLRYDNFVDCFAALKWQNQALAARNAGFAVSSARQTAHRIMTCEYVKQAITKKKALMAKKVGFTIDIAQQEYEEARVLALQCNQPAAMVSATTGKARLYGMDKDAGSAEKVVIVIGPKVVKSIDSKEIDDVQG